MPPNRSLPRVHPSDQVDPSNALGDQLICEAVANLWAEIQAAADAGDEKAQGLLIMFGAFAAERLGARPKS